MKATFPHMGNLYLAARCALEGLGLETVVPPPCTSRTLSLGAKHAPEFACLPLKINLGNFLEAQELGAEVIVMAGGVGPCRFGYYAQVQREILKDLGLEMEMVVLEPPDAHFSEVVDKIKYLAHSPWQKGVRGAFLGWSKLKAVDELEMIVQRLRAWEAVRGTVDALYREARDQIEDADSKTEIKRLQRFYEEQLNDVRIDRTREVVRVGVVGEIYTVLEDFSNLNLERNLGRQGAEVVRSIYLSRWINDHLLGGILPLRSNKHLKRLARPYLSSFVGGHGRETVGGMVEYARKGLDGVIQVAPLTCMPEIVAHSVLPSVSKHYGVPTMTLYVDEHSGEAGIVTRLEAFTDMLRRRKVTRRRRKVFGSLSWN